MVQGAGVDSPPLESAEFQAISMAGVIEKEIGPGRLADRLRQSARNRKYWRGRACADPVPPWPAGCPSVYRNIKQVERIVDHALPMPLGGELLAVPPSNRPAPDRVIRDSGRNGWAARSQRSSRNPFARGRLGGRWQRGGLGRSFSRKRPRHRDAALGSCSRPPGHQMITIKPGHQPGAFGSPAPIRSRDPS